MADYLQYKDLQRLRKATTSSRDYLLIEVQYQTGCTVSELVDIKREDIKPNIILIKNRQCHVASALIEKIQEEFAKHQSRFLFPSRQAEKMTPKRVQQIIKKYLKDLEIPIKKPTPHLLRYTHIAHAIKQHIPQAAIMGQTGLGELRLSQIISEVTEEENDPYGRMFK